MQAVEAARGTAGGDLTVHKLTTRMDNTVNSGNDYGIDLKR